MATTWPKAKIWARKKCRTKDPGQKKYEAPFQGRHIYPVHQQKKRQSLCQSEDPQSDFLIDVLSVRLSSSVCAVVLSAGSQNRKCGLESQKGVEPWSLPQTLCHARLTLPDHANEIDQICCAVPPIQLSNKKKLELRKEGRNQRIHCTVLATVLTEQHTTHTHPHTRRQSYNRKEPKGNKERKKKRRKSRSGWKEKEEKK